ncbi:heavy-metal-associated domain-containing protein [Cypionkella sp.]|uniref:heavy-metal-associated domain-containing protein n=1 Tax=Cypionkella sp. TaxID=2811411 RepID=UPI00271DA900|nr:heavy-metal-associated domain-containing protein [Cypionkella sp.]MDO8986392.1 heavy-metal-associated domain-containing protein [Cypionkella sp.]MDP1577639.1 heavy-metal-associated domain-containing protein [Cypionkella sp.]MDP2048267.1 heavy-metal-associated domain-containing protein [Cypionkella sp.]
MTRLSIPSMSCGHCKATVEKTVASLDPAAKVAVDLATRHVDVTSTSTTAALIAALKGAGFAAAVA